MKKRISLFLATSLIFSSFAFTYGATENNATTYNSVVSSIPKTVTKGISKTSINNIVYGTSNTGVKDIDGIQYINDTPLTLTILPTTTIEKTEVTIKIDNSKFLADSLDSEPFVYSTSKTHYGYDYLMGDDLVSSKGYDKILAQYVKGEGEYKLPYKLEYVDETTLKLSLYPISGENTFTQNGKATSNIAEYVVPLPVSATENENVKLSISSDNEAISPLEYTVPNKKDITVTKFSKEDIKKMNDNPMYKDYILNHSEDFPTFEDYYNFVMDPSISPIPPSFPTHGSGVIRH